MHINNEQELEKFTKSLSIYRVSKPNGEDGRKRLLKKIIDYTKRDTKDNESRAFGLFLKGLINVKESASLTAFGLGTVCHLGPGNVPINALYSWAISYWCGNTNITRISGQPSQAVKRLINEIWKLTNLNDDSEIFVSEMSGEKFLRTVSHYCDGRIMWGSDNVLNKIKEEIPVASTTKDIFFGTKITAAIINTSKIMNLSKEEKEKIIQCITNDFFYEYGGPCTSPSCIIAISDKTGQIRMLNELLDEAAFAAQEKYRWSIENFSRREKKLQEFIMYEKNPELLRGSKSNLWLLKSSVLTGKKRSDLLLELQITSCEEQVIELIKSRYNNFVCFGISEKLKETLKSMNGTKGVQDLGKAHLFTTKWDGIDLIRVLSRNYDH